MIEKLPIRERGTATLGISVADNVLRNRKITKITKNTAINNSKVTSSTEDLIVFVLSLKMFISIELGNADFNVGNNCFIVSVTFITLAPGWRWMFNIIAGVLFTHAACFTSSTSSITLATSESLTAAPFIYFIIKDF